ncbi:MAG: methionyl-tRNA formyltransferase [Desulfobulbus propionicus]|nr:MAG: methionyl-tRNA formyltransferase [Desulfobulbus propionicus]
MSDPLNIIFMGTPDFAVPSLKALLDGPDNVVAVVCQPDRKKGRGRKLLSPPVKVAAVEAGLPVLQPEKVKTGEFLDQLASFAPDLIVVVAYGKILPESILELPPMGAINVHGSLLPKYRGAAPIQWAVINGEEESGVTIMQMDKGMDTGDILYPVAISVEEQDTAGSLFDKLAALGGTALTEAVEKLKKGELQPVPQEDSLATHAPMLTKEQGHIDWSKPAAEIHCLIRGLDPWPSAYSFLADKRFRFFAPQLITRAVTEPPGTVCRADNQGLLIATGEQYILIGEIQPEGKKRMSVQACLNGMTIEPGATFT